MSQEHAAETLGEGLPTTQKTPTLQSSNGQGTGTHSCTQRTRARRPLTRGALQMVSEGTCNSSRLTPHQAVRVRSVLRQDAPFAGRDQGRKPVAHVPGGK